MSITNMPKSETMKALMIIENSAFEFTLTGSRFFNESQYDDNTDYDFFTEDREDTEEYLIKEGFTKKRLYKGMIGISKLYELGKVQIQLVEDAKLKQTLQTVLNNKLKIGGLDKRYRTYYWRFAYMIAETVIAKGA